MQSVPESNALLRRKDTSGSVALIYPITIADNVDGLENVEFITTDDIDEICGASIVNATEATF